MGSKTLAYIRYPNKKWKVLNAFRCEETASMCASNLAEELGQSLLTLAIVQPFEEKFATQVFYVDEEQDISLVKQFYVKDETELEQNLESIPEPKFSANKGLVYPEGLNVAPSTSFRQTQQELDDLIFRPGSSFPVKTSTPAPAVKAKPKGKSAPLKTEDSFRKRMETELTEYESSITKTVEKIISQSNGSILREYKIEFQSEIDEKNIQILSIKSFVHEAMQIVFYEIFYKTQNLKNEILANGSFQTLPRDVSPFLSIQDAVELSILQFVSSTKSYNEDFTVWKSLPKTVIKDFKLGDSFIQENFEICEVSNPPLKDDKFAWVRIFIPKGSNGVWLSNGDRFVFILPPCSEFEVIKDGEDNTLLRVTKRNNLIQILTPDYIAKLYLLIQFLSIADVDNREAYREKLIQIMKEMRCVYKISDGRKPKAITS